MKNLSYKTLATLLAIIITGTTVISCSTNTGLSPGPNTPDPTTSFIVSKLLRSTDVLASTTNFRPDSYRTSFTTFSIATDSTTAEQYRIGAKVAIGTTPTVSDLISVTSALTLTLGSTAINVYLP